MQSKRFNHYNHKRHLVQALCLGVYFLLPHLSLLKLDFTSWKIHFFGLTLVPGLLHIFYLAFLIPFFLLIVMSALYSKVFCGWLCPQNVFFEMFEAIKKSLAKRYPSFRQSPRQQNLLDLSLALIWGAAISANLLCYFEGLHPIPQTALFTLTFGFFVYDTHWLKHKFCENACPYAFLQKSMASNNSLHVIWEDRPGNKCGVCTACEKACYVDLNIREDPFAIDCTMCGACVDACENVFRNKAEPALLSFNVEANPARQWTKRFSVVLLVLFLTFLGWTIVSRPSLTFRVDYPVGGTKQQLPYRLHGKHTNAFTVRVRNLTENQQHYSIELPTDYQTVEPITTLHAEPFEKVSQPIQVQYYGEGEPESVQIFELSLLQENQVVASQELFFKRAPRDTQR